MAALVLFTFEFLIYFVLIFQNHEIGFQVFCLQ